MSGVYVNTGKSIYATDTALRDVVNQLSLVSAIAPFIQTTNALASWNTSDPPAIGSNHNLLNNNTVLLDPNTGDITQMNSISFTSGNVADPVPGSLWLNDSNNHLYHGGVDIEATGGNVSSSSLSSVTGNIASFSDTSGVTIGDSGINIDVSQNITNTNSISFNSNAADPIPGSVWLNSMDNHIYHGSVDLETVGTGDVKGPASANINEIPLYNAMDGKLLKNSNVFIDTSKNMGNLKSLAFDPSNMVPVPGSLWLNNGDNHLYHGSVDLEEVGLGDVNGPASSTPRTISIFTDGSGKVIGNSGILIDNVGNFTSPKSISFSSAVSDPMTGSLWLNSGDNHLYHGNLDIEGNVIGPAVSTDSGLAIYSGTLGNEIKDCTITVDDDSNLLNINSLSLIPRIGQPIFGSIWLRNSDNHIMHNSVDLENQGDVIGPSSATLNELALFSNINGKVIAGSGINFASVGDVKGPASSSNNEVAIYSGTTGKIIKNSSILSSNLGNVFGPVSAVNNNLVAFDSTTGKLIKDSGISSIGTISGTAVITDIKPPNTNGGTFNSGSWITRTLNNIVTNGNSGASLTVTNQITLTAGTYRLTGYAPARNVQSHQCRIQNITDATTTIIGESQFTQDATGLLGIGGGIAVSDSQFDGIFTIATTKTFELQHQCSNSQATNGFGVATNFGISCVYSKVVVTRFN